MTNFRATFLRSGSFIALGLLLPASAAIGQAPAVEDGDEVAIEDIVVTARGREQSLHDVPVSVSVVSGALLERSNLKTLEDMSARLPNVKITSGPLVDQINIRGVGSGQNSGFEQSVATFVDGLYRGRSRSTRAALFDVERVEVLKGPQTTFFGANAIAGALNITSRKPGHEFSFDASALYELVNGEYNVEGAVTLPASDALRFRLATRISGEEGYIDNGSNGRGPDNRSQQARFAVAWEPISTLTSDLRIDYGRSRTRNAFPFELIGCPAPAPFSNTGTACSRFIDLRGGTVDNTLDYHSDSPDSKADYDFLEVAWTNNLDLGGGTLKTITGYFEHDYFQRLHPIIPVSITGTVQGYDPAPVETAEKYSQWSQEVRFESRTGGLFEYMVGGYFAKGDLDARQHVGFFFSAFGAIPPIAATGLTATTPITGKQIFLQKDRTISGFAAVTIRPLDTVRINLSGRYSSIHKEADRANTYGSTVNGNGTTFVQFGEASQTIIGAVLGADMFNFARPKRTDEKFMPSAGIQVDLTPQIMAYATYSAGFKAGGYNSAARAVDFNPENVDAYEAGLKASLFDRRVNLNLAAFRSDYRDLQETTVVLGSGGTIQAQVTNAAGSRAQGLELGLNARLSPHATISTDIAYLDATYRDYKNGSCTILANLAAGCIQDLSGKRRGYAPEFSGNVTLNVTIPAGSNVVTIDPSLYFSSRFFESATADPLLEQPGYSKVDLRIGFGPADRKWEVALIGKNLTDKITAGFRNAVSSSAGTIYALTDRPRSVALRLSIRQ